jgi:hypothetical protein
MIGEGNTDSRDLPPGGTWIGSFGNRPVIASDLEVNHSQRYDLEGGRVATDLRRRPEQITGGSLIRTDAKTAAFA